DTESPTRVRELAAALGAMGSLTAGALHDSDGARDVYVFLPPDTDVRGVGGFASEIDRAMRRAAVEGLVLHSAVLRSGRRRLIIRRPAGSNLLVAGGETERPGLAYRQVESAALALGAR